MTILETAFSEKLKTLGLRSLPLFAPVSVEPELYGRQNFPELERITSLDTHSTKIKCVLWWPTGRHDKVVTADEDTIFLWSMDTSKKTAQNKLLRTFDIYH
ncbi:unnamed protein product [Fraxinus pennsylvanica]|uniref:Uncharacterized protein n=1 Tax=Fraxinus pennsylvanica TaxID=56036 RepID=A0AAD1ZLJ7_9LAMI|nr:unnamed protein product [Fraxinus pennsylvanica]